MVNSFQLGEELGMVKLQRPILHVLLSELKTYSSNEGLQGQPKDVVSSPSAISS